MANTYTQIYLHIVFSVKGRLSLIQNEWKDELYKYICGIINIHKQKVYAIGGVSDHIHLVVSVKPNVIISDLVKMIKANSTKWINQKKLIRGKFQWQEGFGAFSYSHSHLNAVLTYVNNQEQHHKKISFKEEYKTLLEKFEITFEDKYLFDWIE